MTPGDGWKPIKLAPEKLEKQFKAGTGVVEFVPNLDKFYATWITVASVVPLGWFKHEKTAKNACERKGGTTSKVIGAHRVKELRRIYQEMDEKLHDIKDEDNDTAFIHVSQLKDWAETIFKNADL